MKEAIGDLFSYPCDARVIPTNGQLRSNGLAIMGAGVAKQAATQDPHLALCLGKAIQRHGVRCEVIDDGPPATVAFPTKYNWRQDSDRGLIAQSTAELVALTDHYNWRTVAMPRVGAGLGGLRWSDIGCFFEGELDDRFVIVSLQQGG